MRLFTTAMDRKRTVPNRPTVWSDANAECDENRSSSRRAISPFGLMLVVVLASGCQQGMYQATSLPRELSVVPLVDTQKLDLARLASNTSNSQRIHPGDQLSLTMVTGAEEVTPDAWPVRVADDGTAQIPLVGNVHLAGHDLQSAQSIIATASIERGVFRQPTVAITVDERRTNRVTVMGAVEEPGEYDLTVDNSDLLTAIGVAGGMTANADTVVEISQPPAAKRSFLPPNQRGRQNDPAQPGDKETPDQIAQVAYNSPLATNASAALTVGQSERGHIDLVRATASPPPSGFPLRDGSVVIVRKRTPRFIHVLGLVNRPDQFELPANQNIRVLDALALAAGRTFSLADRVFVVRHIPYSTKPALIEVSVREAKENSAANILLADGDVISVEETPTTMVLGVLQQFIRFGVNGSVKVF